MRNIIFVVFILLFQYLNAQPNSVFFVDQTKVESPKWIRLNKASLDVSEVAFVNWNSGGSNSVSALIGFESAINYKYKHFIWNNNLVLKYGINKQQEQELRKTEDLIEINSSLDYKQDNLSNWYFSSRFNFKTQHSNGYNYPNTSNVISKFMAPGYLFSGGGIEYGKNLEKLSVYFSPLTIKSTFVLDQELANSGAFGVTSAILDDDGQIVKKGEKIRNEIGVLVTNKYETQIFDNISIKHFVSLYTDYLDDFGNIDVDWQVNFDFKVNNFVRTTLGSHLKYDDDVKTLVAVAGDEDEYVEKGAKVQWKQLLGIGVFVDF